MKLDKITVSGKDIQMHGTNEFILGDNKYQVIIRLIGPRVKS